MNYTFTQPICTFCWYKTRPDKESIQNPQIGELEICSICGSETYSGIYIRCDPTKVSFPTLRKED